MNNQTKKQTEEQIRLWIRNILKEDRQSRDRPLLLEFGWSYVTPEALADTWITPFANVFKAAKVAVKDVASSAKLNLDLLFTFDPDKMEEHHKDWASRKQKINAEYKEVMAPIEDALGTGDAALVGFMMNPAGYLGYRMVKGGAVGAAGVVNDLEEAGFDLKIPAMLGIGAAVEKEATKEPDEPGVIGGTLKNLAKLFFIAHHEPRGMMITEAEEDKQESSGDVSSQIKEYFEELGILDKIESDGESLAAAKIAAIDNVMNDARAKFGVLDPIYQSKDAQEFKAALEKASASGVDLGGANLSAAGNELKKSVDQILGDEESKNAMVIAVLQSKGEDIPEDGDVSDKEIPDDELRSHVEKVVFMQSKQPLQKQIFDSVKDLGKATMDAVLQDMPPEEDWDVISEPPHGKKMIDAVKSAVAEIKK